MARKQELPPPLSRGDSGETTEACRRLRPASRPHGPMHSERLSLFPSARPGRRPRCGSPPRPGLLAALGGLRRRVLFRVDGGDRGGRRRFRPTLLDGFPGPRDGNASRVRGMSIKDAPVRHFSKWRRRGQAAAGDVGRQGSGKAADRFPVARCVRAVAGGAAHTPHLFPHLKFLFSALLLARLPSNPPPARSVGRRQRSRLGPHPHPTSR